jgi:hypothetical protein
MRSKSAGGNRAGGIVWVSNRDYLSSRRNSGQDVSNGEGKVFSSRDTHQLRSESLSENRVHHKRRVGKDQFGAFAQIGGEQKVQRLVHSVGQQNLLGSDAEKVRNQTLAQFPLRVARDVFG